MLRIIILIIILWGNNVMAAEGNVKTAIFAGGCFWCMEPPFDKMDGVISTTSGYTGGHKENPSYEEVSSGTTGHIEVVQIVYDASKVDYKTLLDTYWVNIDPTVENRQFCDVGEQYRSAIFYNDEEERKLALESVQQIKDKGIKVFTEIIEAGTFYAAEEYHQDYYKKNPIRYKFYRTSCGRDKRLKEIWGDNSGH